MTTGHDGLLNAIKVAIDQLINDKSVPQRQIIGELNYVREYIGSAIPINGDETAAERDEI
jgi:hypothetical protein